MRARAIRPLKRPPDADLEAPASKSATHRALVAAALADGESLVDGALDAEDTRRTVAALAALGVRLAESGSTWTIEGGGGRFAGGASIDLGESGTTCRLVTAAAALGERPSRLDGSPRLRERPLAPLVRALRELGARVEGEALPLVAGGAPALGGVTEIEAGRSSQFASALLLVGSRLPAGLDLTLGPPVVSAPYVEMTLRTLEAFGARVRREGPLRIRLEPAPLRGRRFAVEGDHSSASYLLAAAAITGGRVRVHRLDPASPQADARFGALLGGAGVNVLRGPSWIEVRGDGRLEPFDVDLSDAPDLAPTVAAAALFSDGASRLRGLGNLRLKESDRLDSLAENLAALGAGVRIEGDALVIERAAGVHGGLVRTRSDHRTAMAFAVAGLRIPGVEIDDDECVVKSYPRFWDDLAALDPGIRTGS